MATVTFLEPGSDTTQDLTTFWQATSTSNGTVTSATDQKNTGLRSIKSNTTSGTGFAYVYTPDGKVADAGSLISVWVRLSTAAPSANTDLFGVQLTGNGAVPLRIVLTTTGKLRIQSDGTASVTGSTTLSANTWYRLSFGYVIVATNNWSAILYLNGVQEVSASNTNGTIGETGSTSAAFGISFQSGVGAAMSVWFDDIYIDNRTDKSDCGAIQVTAKRPFANGTTNGYSTQIGAGGSGYGSGHAPQVNEQPLSATNGWSMIGAGSAITEEYNIEGLSVGDVDLTGATISVVMGWVFTKAGIAETGKIIVDGTSTNISITTSNKLFTQNSATPTVYPAGTGTDIGEITSTTVTTVSLYECGILIAFIPGAVGPTVPQEVPAFYETASGMMIGQSWS